MRSVNVIHHLYAEAALSDILLHGDQHPMTGLCQTIQHFRIYGLDKAGIHQGQLIPQLRRLLPDMYAGGNHGAGCQNGDFLSFIQKLRFSQYNRCLQLAKLPVGGAAGIAHTDGHTEAKGKFQHILQLPGILRCHHRHVRNTGQEGIIKDSLMGFAVRADKSRPVNCKHHRQLLQTDIMHNLVISSLQEAGIHGHHRLQSQACHACC